MFKLGSILLNTLIDDGEKRIKYYKNKLNVQNMLIFLN